MLTANEKTMSLGLLLLRVAFGCLMMVHGIQKVMGFSTLSEGFADPIGVGSYVSLILAIGAELGCSVLLIIGLFTRLSLIPLAITMGVALFIVHGGDEWKTKELAAVYLVAYIGLFVAGPGRFSVDYVRGIRKKRAAS